MNERFGAPEPGFRTWTAAMERDENLGVNFRTGGPVRYEVGYVG